MWLYVIYGVADLFGFYAWTYQILMFFCFAFGCIQFGKIRNFNVIDILVFTYISYILLNSIAIDYPQHLRFWINALIFQICPFMCYFIARTTNYATDDILEKMIIPMAIVMVLGIYFFYAQPDWYTARKWEAIYDRYGEGINSNNIIEKFRLSSIWQSSYYISFATIIFINYLIYEITQRDLEKKRKIIIYSLLGVSIVTLILTQHRSCFAGVALTYAYYVLTTKKVKLKMFLLLLGAGIGVVFIYIMYSSPEYTEYVLSRLQDASSVAGIEDRLEYTGGNVDLNTVFGQGYGRYMLKAREYGGWSIIDSEYQKHLAELGYVGFTIFVLIILSSLFKGLTHKGNELELCILLFFVVAFVGASALSINSEYSFVFWYIVGRISRNKNMQLHTK